MRKLHERQDTILADKKRQFYLSLEVSLEPTDEQRERRHVGNSYGFQDNFIFDEDTSIGDVWNKLEQNAKDSVDTEKGEKFESFCIWDIGIVEEKGDQSDQDADDAET